MGYAALGSHNRLRKPDEVIDALEVIDKEKRAAGTYSPFRDSFMFKLRIKRWR